MTRLQPGMTTDQVIKNFGIALRYETDGERGAWVAAFQFAGPDVVATGPTPEIAMERFKMNVAVENEGLEALRQKAEQGQR